MRRSSLVTALLWKGDVVEHERPARAIPVKKSHREPIALRVAHASPTRRPKVKKVAILVLASDCDDEKYDESQPQYYRHSHTPVSFLAY